METIKNMKIEFNKEIKLLKKTKIDKNLEMYNSSQNTMRKVSLRDWMK